MLFEQSEKLAPDWGNSRGPRGGTRTNKKFLRSSVRKTISSTQQLLMWTSHVTCKLQIHLSQAPNTTLTWYRCFYDEQTFFFYYISTSVPPVLLVTSCKQWTDVLFTCFKHTNTLKSEQGLPTWDTGTIRGAQEFTVSLRTQRSVGFWGQIKVTAVYCTDQEMRQRQSAAEYFHFGFWPLKPGF